jgi:hypothetical protein
VRELFKNALEAGGTRIELGPEWQAVEELGVYRLMAADNGKGMGPDELLKFLNTFGGGGARKGVRVRISPFAPFLNYRIVGGLPAACSSDGGTLAGEFFSSSRLGLKGIQGCESSHAQAVTWSMSMA